jgi:hypothetical protein
VCVCDNDGNSLNDYISGNTAKVNYSTMTMLVVIMLGLFIYFILYVVLYEMLYAIMLFV